MTPINRRTALGLAAVGSIGLLRVPPLWSAPNRNTVIAPGFTIEYYYKVRWGAWAEFRRLYIKNHLPILRRYEARGYILAMAATIPIVHGAESVRWDLRFDITWKDAAAALEALPDEEAITRELFPDQATFQREEQQRFALIEEHLDIPVSRADLATW